MKRHEIRHNRWVIHNPILRGGYFTARVRDKKTGETKYYATRQKVQRNALEAARDWVDRLKAEEEAPEAMNFETAYGDYLEAKRTTHRAITQKSYRDDAARYFFPTFGKVVLSSIRFVDVEKWVRVLEAKGLGPSTRRSYVERLGAFFNWAKKREFMAENPVHKLDPIRVKERVKPRVLTVDEARRLLAAPMAERLRLAILLSLHTGLRRKNVAELVWGQVDLARRRIFIPGPYMKAGFHFETAINLELAAELRKLPFLDPKAAVLGAKILRPDMGFTNALARAGLPHMRWHDLRHTFAAWVGKHGSHDMKMALMGHAARDQSDEYGGVSFEEKLEFIDTLSPLLIGPESSKVSGSQGTM